MRITLWTTLLLVACAKPPAEQAAVRPVAEATGTLVPTTPADTEPAASTDPEATRWRLLSERLRAHDTQDLPDHDALAAFPDAAEGLVWLASHDPALFVRARALDAIGVLGAPGAAEVLSRALADTTHASSLRAAAAIGLGRLRDPAATVALLAAVEDADARVASQSVDVLAANPAARDALKALAQKPGLAPEVRAQIEALH